LFTKGEFEQATGAFVDTATIKKDVITDGSQAAASQSTKGTYKAPNGGIGVTAALGISHASAHNTEMSADAAAVTANIGVSGVLGYKSCATLKGEGEHATVAVKDYKNASGAAMTNGSFNYKGQTGNGAVIGAGVTGGISSVKTGKNHVTSVAGGGTASGITSTSIR
jgi:hypothetical protein